ncbi:anhydro-N-acetylmuramic acid kinase [Cardiobacteriaceae bacterium TAE3-ERU3]|nr:anhydro-N-acetylmuramic acid kinase [Cardiobacteriaceae bacterium TAE3-ERU3]
MVQKYYIGVMSGTSLDGVDVVLVDMADGQTVLVAQSEYAMPAELKADILAACSGEPQSLQAVGELDRALGCLFAAAVNHLLDEHQIDRNSVRAIGCHGQTVWHQPDGEHPFTMQIGDANIIAARTGIDTVADFRRKDVALGGQGAPLVPAFHHTLFGSPDSSVVVLNIGGIANITVLRPGQPVLGYDTGPGNMLMDSWYQQQSGEHYDRDAHLAQQGEVNQVLLDKLLQEPWLARSAPKSTGRELFSKAWLAAQLNGIDTSAADVQRTLCEYTAVTIAAQITQWHSGEHAQILVCGGGARNPLLMQRLRELLPDWDVSRTDDHGVSSDYMEAMAFAWLAYRFEQRLPGNVPEVTGASRPAVLGVLYPAA